MQSYQASQSKLKAVCRRSTFNDFRTKATVRLGEAPKVLKVPENGSVVSGPRAESHESYRGYTWARIFAITREALINDDLGAFADFGRAWGTAASSLEADVLVDLLYGAAGVGPTMTDTFALFHANHGNLAAGAAISDTTLGAARLALRTMKGLDAATIIEVNPRYLVVPAALETTAEKYLASLYAWTATLATWVSSFPGRATRSIKILRRKLSMTGYIIPGPPQMAAKATVEANAASATLTVANFGKIDTNTGAGATIILTLPKASDCAGCAIKIQITAAQIVRVLPVTGEKVYLGGDGVASKYLNIAGVIGNFADLFSDGVDFQVINYSGILTKEA